MSDGDINFEEGAGESGAPAKNKTFSGFILGILKWILIALGAVILIVVVVVITVRFVGNNTTRQVAIPTSDEYHVQREALAWYSSLGPIRTRTSDDVPASVIANVYLGYTKEDKAAATELNERKVELVDYLRRYFTEKTIEELKPNNEARLKIELRNAINDEILSNSKIRDVSFQQLDVVEQ